MITSFQAEWRKLSRRPALWWLSGLALAVVGVFYVFSWVKFASPSFHPDPGTTLAQLKAGLYPVNFAINMVQGMAPVIGAALTLVLGALVVGSEYAWGTLKTVYTQRASRLQALAGQLAAVSAINAILVSALFAVSAVLSWVSVTMDGHAAVWPAAVDILKAAGATWLIFECWTLFGMAMSYLFRQSAVAIGLGLAYMLAIEGILFRALSSFHLDWLGTAEKFFVGQNAGALAGSFGQSVSKPGISGPLVSAEQAVIVLALYGLAFMAAALALVRFRDVT